MQMFFWQFWLFFVFKLVVILLLVVRESRVFLPMLPSWPEESSLFDGIAKVMRSKPGAVVDYL